jgi:hypothetical protein
MRGAAADSRAGAGDDRDAAVEQAGPEDRVVALVGGHSSQGKQAGECPAWDIIRQSSAGEIPQ